MDLARITEWPSDEGGPHRVAHWHRAPRPSRQRSFVTVEFLSGEWMVVQHLTVEDARYVASLIPATDCAVRELDEAADTAERYNVSDSGP
jgi:hypothetical protein